MIIDVRQESEAKFGGYPYSVATAIRNHVCLLEIGDTLIVERMFDAFGAVVPPRHIQIQAHVAKRANNSELDVRTKDDGSVHITRIGKITVGKSRFRQWPFKSMKVGDVAEFRAPDEHARINAHNYGRVNGWKFKSKTIDGVIRITRLA